MWLFFYPNKNERRDAWILTGRWMLPHFEIVIEKEKNAVSCSVLKVQLDFLFTISTTNPIHTVPFFMNLHRKSRFVWMRMHCMCVCMFVFVCLVRFICSVLSFVTIQSFSIDFNESYAVDLRLAFRFILEFYWKPFNLQLKCGFIIGNIIRISLPGWCMFALYTVSSEFNVDRLRCYRKTNSLNWTICPLSIHCWFTSKNQNKNKNKCSDLKYHPCEVSPVNRSNVICLYNLFEVNVEAVVSVKRIRIVACGEDNRWLTVNNKSK